MTEHIPVLLQEVLDGLAIQGGDTVCDATVGGAGYTKAFCEAVGKSGTVIGIDQDADAIEHAKKTLTSYPCKKHLAVSNFRNIDEVLKEVNVAQLDACAFDLGFSSIQLEESGRGFSFQKDEPLLMTLSHDTGRLTAKDIVNTWDEDSVANVLYGYGEERRARKIARAIVVARKKGAIETTGDLLKIVESVSPRSGKTHPATRVFQALRIAVNDELSALEEGLKHAVSFLSSGGHVAVVSFHSLEDRIVKKYFRELKEQGTGMQTAKKPIVPKDVEVKANPRSRSAKLRIFKKI